LAVLAVLVELAAAPVVVVELPRHPPQHKGGRITFLRLSQDRS
jgi:hypothetical protein